MNKLLELMVLAIKESENITVKDNWSFYYVGGVSHINIIHYPHGIEKSKDFVRTGVKLTSPEEIEIACAFIQERLLFPPTS